MSNITGDKSSGANIGRTKPVAGDARFAVFVSDGVVDGKFGIEGLTRALAGLYKKDKKGCTAESLADGIFAASDTHLAGREAGDDRLAVVVDVRACRKKLLASK
jgi:hypothetical protein